MASTAPQRFKPQKINYFQDALCIHLVDFPIYYIECISERHFVVAGGGGASKTGVHNQINILEIVPTGESCAAELVLKYYIPGEDQDAIMAASLMKDLPIISTRLVTGGRVATIYRFSFDAQNKTFSIVDYEPLKDKQVRDELKSIKYSDSKIYAGSTQGEVIVWNVSDGPETTTLAQFNAHTQEVDDIDVDLKNHLLVTVSRNEGKCVVWNTKSFKTIQEFKRDFINTKENPAAKYSYRSCKFAYDTARPKDDKQPSYLFIACNPIPKTGPSKLYRLNSPNLKEIKSIPLAQDGVMAMTVSLDGRFVATGTRSGSVMIHEVKNLKQLYKIEGAHHNAVTCLEFLPPKPESLRLTNSTTCALLSCSIDRRVVLHRPKKGSATSRAFQLVIMVIALYLIFSWLYKYYI